MLAFLPWEKLPSWLLGSIMVIVGSFLWFYTEPYSWYQLEAVFFVIIGLALFIDGVKKLIAQSRTEGENPISPSISIRNKNVNSMTFHPEFAKYSEVQLRQILTRIDAERFPERVAEINTRLANFKKNDSIAQLDNSQ